MTDSPSRRSPPAFKSRLRRLTILDLERMSPAQRQRREADEQREVREWRDRQKREATKR
jgi:hypothetical protein